MSKKMNLIERFYQEVFGFLKRLRRFRKGGALPHFRGVVCLLAFVICHLTFVISASQAAFPQEINYQGKLTNASNIPVSNANYSMVFTIYDAASGGTNKWTETQTVTTESGFFNVVLGIDTPIGTNVFDGYDRWLGIKVGSDSEMTPRQKLTAVGHAFYAYNADQLDGHQWSEVPTGGNYVLKAGDTMTGNLTMGASSINIASGTYSLPSLSFAAAPTLGFYYPASNYFRAVSGGTVCAEFGPNYIAANTIFPYTTTAGLQFYGMASDGAAAKANKFGNYWSLTASGAKIASFYSDQFTTEKAYLDKDGTFSTGGLVRAVSLESTVATGTAPLTVASTTVVTNLNADKLDGHDWSEIPGAGDYVAKAGDTMTGTLTNSASVYVSDKVGIGTAANAYAKLEVWRGTEAYTIVGSYSGVTDVGLLGASDAGARGLSSNPSGYGVDGENTSTTGTATGVRGRSGSSTGRGVYAWAEDGAGVNYALYAQTGSSNGYALYAVGGRNYFEGNVGIGTASPGGLLDIAGKATIEADGDITTSAQLKSTVATGTAPLTVASTTKVDNLNADRLDDKHASDFIASSDLTNYVLKAGDTMTGTLTNTAGTSPIGINVVNNQTTTANNLYGVYSSVQLDDSDAYTRDQYGGYFVAGGGGSVSNSIGVSGVSNASNVDSDSIGVYGSGNIGVKGEYDSNHFGYLGGSSYGVFGRANAASDMAVLASQGNDSGYAIFANGGKNYFAGNVGIGTMDPGATLEVSGNVKATKYESTVATGTAPLTVASTTVVTNLNADKLDGHDWSEIPSGTNYVLKAGDTMTGTLTTDAVDVPDGKVFNFKMVSSQPFTVASTTKVTNLNADLLDDHESTYFAPASASGLYVQLGPSSIQSTVSNKAVWVSGEATGVSAQGATYGVFGTDGTRYGYLGGTNYGAYGQYSNTIYGYLGSTDYGAWGQYSDTQYGILGDASAGVIGRGLYGVYGQGTSYGVYGNGYTGEGVHGEATSGYGVRGNATTGYGVYGSTGTKYGYLGSANYGGYAQYDANNRAFLGTSSFGVSAEGTTYGLYGTTSGSALLNAGVYGKATAAASNIGGFIGEATGTGNITNYGGAFFADGDKGVGVYGSANSKAANVNYGGKFQAKGTGGSCGVYGETTENTGTNYGVYGKTNSGYGVYGTDGTRYGYLGSASYGGYAQYDASNKAFLGGSYFGVSAEGTTYGVYGQNGTKYGYLGSTSYGAYGTDGTRVGYLGSANYGVYGNYADNWPNGYIGSSDKGVAGFTGPFGGTYGVYGDASGGGSGAQYGVYGKNAVNNYGFLGGYDGAISCGVYGRGLSSGYGVYGTDGTRIGYLGSGSYGAYGQYDANNYGRLGGSGFGVSAEGQTYGVYGHNTSNGTYAYLGSTYAVQGVYGTTQGYIASSANGVYGYTANATGWGGYFTGGYGLFGSLIKSNDGTAAAPSYTFNSETDVGMYRVTTDQIGFATAGTNRLNIYTTRITSTVTIEPVTDNVGQLGTTTTYGGVQKRWAVVCAVNTTIRSADVNEKYLMSQPAEDGDVVFISGDNTMSKCSRPYDPKVAGVVKKTGGLTMDDDLEGGVPVALLGKVPCKVSIENGAIKPGDPLTASSTPGHAMKATQPGTIVGKALQAFDGSSGKTGKIMALVNVSWFGGETPIAMVNP